MGRSLLRALALNESNAAKVTIIVNDDEGAYIDFTMWARCSDAP